MDLSLVCFPRNLSNVVEFCVYCNAAGKLSNLTTKPYSNGYRGGKEEASEAYIKIR
jgi:hypothetical protein